MFDQNLNFLYFVAIMHMRTALQSTCFFNLWHSVTF